MCVSLGRWVCFGQDKAGDLGCRVCCTHSGARNHAGGRGPSGLFEERKLLDVISGWCPSMCRIRVFFCIHKPAVLASFVLLRTRVFSRAEPCARTWVGPLSSGRGSRYSDRSPSPYSCSSSPCSFYREKNMLYPFAASQLQVAYNRGLWSRIDSSTLCLGLLRTYTQGHCHPLAVTHYGLPSRATSC